MARAAEYFRAAILHPWNLMVLGAGIAATAITGSEVPAMLAGGVELAYLGVVPANARFRKAIDARLLRRSRRDVEKQNAQLLAELAPNQREHYLALRQLAERIDANYRRLPISTSMLPSQSQSKITALLQSFLKLLVQLNDYRRYLGSTDREVIERDLAELEVDLASSEEAVREIKKRRIEILKMRLSRFQQAEQGREVVAHQLASIEDMLRLIHEQSITIRDPAAIERQLDALTAEIEVTETTVKEMEQFLEINAEADALAPPVPLRTR